MLAPSEFPACTDATGSPIARHCSYFSRRTDPGWYVGAGETWHSSGPFCSLPPDPLGPVEGPNTSACAIPPQRPCERLLSFTSNRGGRAAALHFLQNFSCFGIYQEHLLNNLEGSGNGAISARVRREVLGSTETRRDEAARCAFGGVVTLTSCR